MAIASKIRPERQARRDALLRLQQTVVTLLMAWSLWREVKVDWLEHERKEQALRRRMQRMAERTGDE